MKTKNMINWFIIICCVLFNILTISCSSESKTKSVIKEWMSKEVLIPKKIIYKNLTTDTITKYILKHSYKILVYVDSIGCTGCRLGLVEWKAFIDRCQSKGYDVGFLFVIQSSDYIKFERKLKMDNFTYPVIYDYTDEFNRLNRFPLGDMFRTYLLDKDNKVVLIGSPIRSEKIWKLYIDVLSKTKIAEFSQETHLKLSKGLTSVKVNKGSVSLGKLKRRIIKKVLFKIKNTGSYPLVIQKVYTSCGCTLAKYDKNPIIQGETTTVVLEYKSNSLGYFNKTADVICNVPEGYVRLRISGEVVE